MQTPPNKRIVSKGRFVQLVGLRAGLGLSGFAFLLLTVPCLILTLFFVFTLNDDIFRYHQESHVILWNIAKTCLLGVGTCLTWKIGFSTVNKAQAMEVGVLLTRFNTADLPAPDSLVRASQEPVQAQETVLLRAATQGQETAAEQLVRPILMSE